MNNEKTVTIEQKEMLESYADKFAEFDQDMHDMMGTTVINQDKLHHYFTHLHAFYLSELTEMKQKILELEQKLNKE